jgi:sigma-B regulation protein RsbU (phosphoserine phosphatase)
MRATSAETRAVAAPYQLLAEISQRISGTVDLQDVVRHLLDAVGSVVDYDAAGIFVLNRPIAQATGVSPDLIGAMATVGFDHIAPGHDPMLRSGKGIVGHVIRTGEVVVASDVRESPHYIEGRSGTRSELAVPILINGQVIGALNLESNRSAAYSDADAELLQAFAVAAAIGIEKARLHQEVVEKHLIDQQLRIAREVQGGLLPAAPPELADYDIAGLNVPAWDIGGDYFDYLPLDANRLGLAVADVAGKGVGAALLMATFRAALRSEVRRNPPLPDLVREIHQTLLDSMDDSRYVTSIYGELDTRTGTFAYVNCGHNPPIVVRSTGEWCRLPVGNRAIGMFGFDPEIAEPVTLGIGDVLVLYTDGVIEASNADGLEFGEDRTGRLVAGCSGRSARAIVDALVEATRRHIQREHYDDDFTVVVVKRLR